jgi:acyl-CoA synthetase (AMP-forming)/AMP-acid ligase II
MSFRALLDSLGWSVSVAEHDISDASSSINYRELLDGFSQLDAYLQDKGIRPDDCIALECDNTTAALKVMLGLFYRGQHLLLLPAQGNPLKEPGFKPDIPAFCNTHITVMAGSADDADIARWVNVYPHEQFDAPAYERLLANVGDERLLLLRTSGSMGDAKIVHFSHAKLLGNAANCTQRFGLTAQSRVTIAVPVFHMYGLGAGFVPALLAGACVNVQANTNILRFLESERRFKPDVVFLNPTIATMLLKGRRNSQPYSRTISAGAALPEQLHQAYRERFGVFTNLYGSTEMGAAATTVAHLDGDKPNRLLPMPGVEMQISSTGQALHCLHPHGFDGYLNSQGEVLPVNTQPYNTGDVAHWLEDGRIELLGRQSDSTNRAGFLVQFADIENALLRTGEVEQAVVLSSTQETVRGHKLYAFCVTKKTALTQNITTQSIRQACFEHLPRYAIPDEIILQEAFPLAPSGKINRRLLQQHIPESLES